MKLTLDYVKKAIKDDPRFDQVIDTDELGKIMVWVKSPWTWDSYDGNRHVEAFIISKDGWHDDVIDTVGHFKRCVKNIEKER